MPGPVHEAEEEFGFHAVGAESEFMSLGCRPFAPWPDEAGDVLCAMQDVGDVAGGVEDRGVERAPIAFFPRGFILWLTFGAGRRISYF